MSDTELDFYDLLSIVVNTDWYEVGGRRFINLTNVVEEEIGEEYEGIYQDLWEQYEERHGELFELRGLEAKLWIEEHLKNNRNTDDEETAGDDFISITGDNDNVFYFTR